ncbi:MAG: hypothetical protein SP4CHLAM5_08260 [Chlamydiia bacterium]|nr:hypothetical protein [Chlamydiia bacterium]MCH9618689.1 hypothetical protein [Chlamydiia bacterium]MCH9624408.1 hypothetical protein [Chlamydiia bacterium]
MKIKLGLIFSVVMIKGFSLAISPIDLEINSSKGQGYYTLINDDKSQKVIAITTKRRTIDEHGKTVLTPTKDIIVYPKQVVLKAKEKRLIRIIWKAKEKVTNEVAYRITFAEQNVDVDFGVDELEQGERRAGLSFGVRFDGSIYIQPKKPGPSNIEVSSYEKKKIEGEDFFVITLENKGNIHKHISTKNLELEVLFPGEAEKENWHMLSEDLLSKYLGTDILLLSGGKRKVQIPCKEKQIPDNVLGVRITE